MSIINGMFYGEREDFMDFAQQGGNARYGGFMPPMAKPLVSTPDPVAIVSNKTPNVSLDINEQQGGIDFIAPMEQIDDPITSAINQVKQKPTKAESTIRTTPTTRPQNPISTSVVQPTQGNIDPRYAEYLRSGEAGDDRGGAQEQQTPVFVQGDDSNRNFELGGFSGYVDDLRQEFGGEFDIGNGIDYRADGLRKDGQPKWESFYFDAKNQQEAKDIATDYFVNKLGVFEDANQLWKAFEIQKEGDEYRLEWDNAAPISKAIDFGKVIGLTALTGGALGAAGITSGALQGGLASGITTAVRGGDFKDVVTSAALGGLGGYASDTVKAADAAREAVVTNAQTIQSGVGGAGAIAEGMSQGLAENFVNASNTAATAGNLLKTANLVNAVDSGNVAAAVSNGLGLAGLPNIESTIADSLKDVNVGISNETLTKAGTKATETYLNSGDVDKALKEGLIAGAVEEIKNIDLGSGGGFDLDLELDGVLGSISDGLEAVWDVTIKPTANVLEEGYQQILESTKDIRSTAGDALDGILEATQEPREAIVDVVEGVAGGASDVLEELWDVTTDVAETIGEGAEDIFDFVLDKLEGFGVSVDNQRVKEVKERKARDIDLIELTTPSDVGSLSLSRNLPFRNPLL